jgi:spermidine synthase
MDARFALLLACFFLSGFAALLYQTAWTRELSFVFGTSELAVAAVLAAYMGGLALGAAAAARYALRLRRPVLAYGVLEAAIALSALSVPAGIRLINAVYVGVLGGGAELPEGGAAAASVFQLGAAFAVLLPPTAFMGATLPCWRATPCAARRRSARGWACSTRSTPPGPSREPCAPPSG